ncbi:MAG TPA: M12 family metallo-peptidase [Thermoanaerobaculia bacterium]|jgi:hypothetical protein|nr:M12 family metallo-peptidase [Thermoanaerobaculia bacterium]
MKRLHVEFVLLGLALAPAVAEATSPLWRPGEPPPPRPQLVTKATGTATHIPVLALYTPERLAAVGSLAALTAELEDERAALNQSLQASGLTDYDFVFADIRLADHHDTGTLAGDLQWLLANWTAPQVAASGAKLVHLFVGDATDYAGLSGGFTPGVFPATSVVWQDAEVGIYVFAHEVGHNLGLSHDPENSPPGAASAWENGHGFRMAGYRDVMSYSNGCSVDFGTDCPLFAGYSDPARTRNGIPLGVPGVSEAVAVLRETLPFMAGDTTCAGSSVALCLQNHRFQVEVTWQTPDGQAGLGQAVPRTTDTGEFWFFAPTNIELVLKVLDGCALGGHYWVFAGGLTNVAVTITVTDTQTNAQRIYENHQVKAFQPIQDTGAFPCQ